jgi:hypothetical protein
MDILGGRECHFCGNEDLRVLELGHKNGDGSGDRKQFKNNRQLRRFYIMHPELAREILRVSCANCNKIKRYEKQEWLGSAVPSTQWYSFKLQGVDVHIITQVCLQLELLVNFCFIRNQLLGANGSSHLTEESVVSKIAFIPTVTSKPVLRYASKNRDPFFPSLWRMTMLI